VEQPRDGNGWPPISANHCKQTNKPTNHPTKCGLKQVSQEGLTAATVLLEWTHHPHLCSQSEVAPTTAPSTGCPFITQLWMNLNWVLIFGFILVTNSVGK
jgi:hypothetical protein